MNQSLTEKWEGATAVMVTIFSVAGLFVAAGLMWEDLRSSFYGWGEVEAYYRIISASNVYALWFLSASPQIGAIITTALYSIEQDGVWQKRKWFAMAVAFEAVDFCFDLWYRAGDTTIIGDWLAGVYVPGYGLFWLLFTTAFYTAVATALFAGCLRAFFAYSPTGIEQLRIVWNAWSPPDLNVEPVRLGMDGQSRLTRMNVRRQNGGSHD